MYLKLIVKLEKQFLPVYVQKRGGGETSHILKFR